MSEAPDITVYLDSYRYVKNSNVIFRTEISVSYFAPRNIYVNYEKAGFVCNTGRFKKT